MFQVDINQIRYAHNRSNLRRLLSLDTYMAASNFLPPYHPIETQYRGGNKILCPKRGNVKATPEELVRQRILNWLFEEKHWPKTKVILEHSSKVVGIPGKTRIRSDIELRDLDDTHKTLVVIECKAPQVPLNSVVEQQAREYDIESKAEYFWITNGEQHKFFVRKRKIRGKRKTRGIWIKTDHIAPLDVDYVPSENSLVFPSVNNRSGLSKYFDTFETNFHDYEYKSLKPMQKKMLLAFHKLFFSIKKKVPSSFGGAHILADLGTDLHQFGNRSGGAWRNLYADFIAATSGRVEALSVSVYAWGGSEDMYLCVGVRKSNRKHHALQLRMKDCFWDSSRHQWQIYHDGRMSSISTHKVLNAVEEAGRGDWIEEKDGKEYLYLGELPPTDQVKWGKSERELLINLLHYGLIRSNLRDAVAGQTK